MYKLPLRVKLAYGCGDMANNIIFSITMTYLMYFYTDSIGISITASSTIFLIARCWDAVCDPVMGFISDHTKSRLGSYRVYLLFIPLPFVIIFILTFSNLWTSPHYKLIWASITYILLMTLYSAVSIPYASLSSKITNDPLERVKLTTYRMIFSFSGGIITNLTMLPLVHWYNSHASRNSSGYTFSVTVLGCVALILYWICFYETKENESIMQYESKSFSVKIKSILTSRAWWMLFSMGIMMFTLSLFPFYSGMYYFKYVVNSVEYAPLYFSLNTAGLLVGALLNLILAHNSSPKKLSIFSGVWGGSISLCLFLIPYNSIALTLIISFLSSLSIGVGASNLWAMVAETSNTIEIKAGCRMAGITTAAISFSMKLGMGIGGAAVGYILFYSGFQPKMPANHLVITVISAMVSIFPAIGYLFFSLFAYYYPSHKKVSY